MWGFPCRVKASSQRKTRESPHGKRYLRNSTRSRCSLDVRRIPRGLTGLFSNHLCLTLQCGKQERAGVLGQVGESSGRIHLSVRGTCKPRATSETASNLGPFSCPSICSTHTLFFFPQVCRPSPFQHLQGMYVRDAFQDLAFHTLQFEWTLAIHIPLCSWTEGDLGSRTEAPQGVVLNTEKPAGSFHYF